MPSKLFHADFYPWGHTVTSAHTLSPSCSDISLSCNFAVIHYETAMICKGPNTHFIKSFPHLLGAKKVLYVNGNAQWCPEFPVIFSNPSFWCSQFPIHHLKLTTNNLTLYDAAEQNETGRPLSTYRGVRLSCVVMFLNYHLTWQLLILLSSFCRSIQSGSTYI